MFSFYQLIEELELLEAVWNRNLSSNNPSLSSWKDKIATAIVRRKAYMKSKVPLDKQLYVNAFKAAQHAKQKVSSAMSRFKMQAEPAEEE